MVHGGVFETERGETEVEMWTSRILHLFWGFGLRSLAWTGPNQTG